MTEKKFNESRKSAMDNVFKNISDFGRDLEMLPKDKSFEDGGASLKGAKSDDFNQDLKNNLKMLDRIEKELIYATKESREFLVKSQDADGFDTDGMETVELISKGKEQDEVKSSNKSDGKTEMEQQPRNVEDLLNRGVVKGLGNFLKDKVFSQDDIIDEIESGLVVNSVNLNLNQDKPAGCYLFAGPSGVGKTETAIQLAKALGVEVLVVNMGEYSMEHDVTKLIGTTSGLIGYKDGGLLTNFLIKNPRCVVVFDELEKAHKSINKILLSILDKGMCRDGMNREILFKNCVFIATTNLGADAEYYEDMSKEEKHKFRMDVIHEEFAPEIINRYDAIFQFNPIGKDIYAKIVNKFASQIDDLSYERNGFKIKLSAKMIDLIVHSSYDPAMGGRPAKRFLEKIVLRSLAFKMLEDDFVKDAKENEEILIDVSNIKADYGKIVVKAGKKVIAKMDDTQRLIDNYRASIFSRDGKIERQDKQPAFQLA